MLDLQFICDNVALVEENCKKRNVRVDISKIVDLRAQRGGLISAGDELRRQQKEVSGSIPKASAEERPALIEQGKQLREQVSQKETELAELEAELRELQSAIPNLTHPDAPEGGEDDAKLVR